MPQGAMTEVAKATVTIIPNMQGSQAVISKDLNAIGDIAGAEAGKKTGTAMSKNIGETMSKAGSTLTKAVTVPLAAVGTAAFAASTSFETSFAKLTTIADTSSVSVGTLKDQIAKLSAETGMSQSAISEAAYSAISAGQDTGHALEFVATAAKLAKGGFTDVSTATDVLTTALNAYGLEASQAAHVSDVLITTQNLGKTTVAELASSMGKVIPTAAAANVGIEDLSSQYVALTKNGIATAEATTYINSMLNELTKSGTNADKAFKEAAGVTFPEYIAQGHSTAEAMKLLGDHMQSTGLKATDAFGSAEAGKAANVLIAHTEDATDALEQMRTKSGQTEEAFGKMKNTTEASLTKMKTAVENLAVSLGSAILPAATPIIEGIATAVTKASDAFSSLPESTQTAIIAIAGIAAAAGPVLMIGGKIATGFTSIKGVMGGFTGTAGQVAESLSNVGSKASTAAAGATKVGSSFKTMAGQALLLLAAGAAVLMIGGAMAIMADAAIRLAEAGPGAIATFVGIAVVAVALTAAIALIGSVATVGAAGLLALGAAVLMVTGGIALLVFSVTGLVTAIGENSAQIQSIITTGASAVNSTIMTVALGISSIITSTGNVIIGVIEAIGNATSSVLNAIAGIFDAIGVSAINCGVGFNILADGVLKLVGTNLPDLAGTMTAVSAGIASIVAQSGKINDTAKSMDTISNSMGRMEISANSLNGTMGSFASGIQSSTGSVSNSFAAMNNNVNSQLSGMNAVMSGKMLEAIVIAQNGARAISDTFANTSFNFNQGHIVLPHFSMSGQFNAETRSVPRVDVDWYKRAAIEGALFDSPTVIGVGDASQPEMLIGERTLEKKLSEMTGKGSITYGDINITLNVPMGADGKKMVDMIEDELAQRMRRKEAIFA